MLMYETKEKIRKLLEQTTLSLKKLNTFHQELIMENALLEISGGSNDIKRRLRYTEECLQNAICLLELGEEMDARIQLETAEYIVS